ncbi:MAG TPA: DUF1127 domain-containing protein [Acetobacteraceae bacterium]|nr:DUF1127 domain-containing protein [Acetobacteraceae bacterium]
MTASFSKHQLAPIFPNDVFPHHISARAPAEQAVRPERASRGLGQRIGQAVSAIRGRQRVFNELHSLTDRELADIGITRGDIHRVFDPAFAAEHRARG